MGEHRHQSMKTILNGIFGKHKLNKGNEPTLVINNRKEVTDLTLGTDKIGYLVINWHVSNEISLSVYRYIEFRAGDLEVTRSTPKEPIGNPIRKTQRRIQW